MKTNETFVDSFMRSIYGRISIQKPTLRAESTRPDFYLYFNRAAFSQSPERGTALYRTALYTLPIPDTRTRPTPEKSRHTPATHIPSCDKHGKTIDPVYPTTVVPPREIARWVILESAEVVKHWNENLRTRHAYICYDRSKSDRRFSSRIC